MSDPYSEATRNERGGRSRFLFFVGGGFLATLLIAVIVWMTVSPEESPERLPETPAEADYMVAAARVAAARAVAEEAEPPERGRIRVGVTREIADGRELARATAALWAELETEEWISVVPVEEESEFTLELKPAKWDRPTTTRLPSLERYLEPVMRGERVFGEMRSRLPEWVPAYPGARAFVYSRGSPPYLPGYAAFVVSARAGEIVDWYELVADFMSRARMDPPAGDTETVKTVRLQPDGGVRERFAMTWGDRLLTLVATEDDIGDSLVVLFFFLRDE